MRDVLLALLFHVGILLGVVIAIGHTEAALHGLRNVTRAVLCILTGAKIEKRVYPDAVQMPDLGEHVLPIFHRLDSAEFFLERLSPHRLDRLFVHSAGVIIADFLCFRRELRIDVYLRCLAGNRVQRVVVALDQLIEGAPPGILWWNLGSLDPCAGGVAEEIVTGLHRRIHVFRIDGRRILCDLRLRLSAQSKRSDN